jgi:amino acid permease
MKNEEVKGVVPEEVAVGDGSDECSSSDAMINVEKKASWVTVGFLQLSDVVGVGILAIGSGIALVGYVPAAFLFCFMLAINIYAGVLMQEVYLLCGQGAYDLPNMARLAVGRRWFTWLVTVLYYSLLFSLIAQTLGVLGSTIKALLPNSSMCNWSFTALAACLVIPLSQVRTLADSRAMQIVNTVTITLCVLISVFYMWARMINGTVPDAQGAEGEPYAFNDEATVDGVMAAVLRFGFSFSGNVIFPQMLHEMSKPHKFYKSFLISSPYQLVMYSIAGFTQFAYEGRLALTDSALIFQVIPTSDPLYGGCALLLAIHVSLGYVTKGTVAARTLHGVISPRTLNERSWTGQAWWLLCTIIVAFGSFLVSSAIPSFNALLGLLSAFQVAPLSFVVPAVLLVGARLKHARASARERSSLILPALLFSFGIVLTGLGIQQSTKGVKESFASGQPPFYC